MIGILFFTVSSQIIGTFFVMDKKFDVPLFFSFLSLGLIHLFFMRVVDDFIDRDHDGRYYRERSLQRGDISLKKLFATALVLLSMVSFYFYYSYGASSLLFISIAIANTLLSIIAFGFGKSFRFDHIIIYHFLNSIGISSLQMLLYFLLEIDWSAYVLIFLHFLLIFSNNFLLEVCRKIKSKEEPSYHDDYISLLGKTKNTFLILGLIIVIFASNFALFSLRISSSMLGFSLYLLYTVFLLYSVYRFHYDASKGNKKFLLLFSLLYFLISNTLFLFS